MPLFVPSRLLSSLGVSRTLNASDWCALQEVLCKSLDTIQYVFVTCLGDGHLERYFMHFIAHFS